MVSFRFKNIGAHFYILFWGGFECVFQVSRKFQSFNCVTVCQGFYFWHKQVQHKTEKASNVHESYKTF